MPVRSVRDAPRRSKMLVRNNIFLKNDLQAGSKNGPAFFCDGLRITADMSDSVKKKRL
jgi:hypothetical protein